MDKVFSMFRVFDIAFFAPGIFLCYILTKYTGVLSFFGQTNLELKTTEGLFQLVMQFGIVFVMGLCIHGMQRIITGKFKLPRGRAGTKQSWYLELEPGNLQELALYFWYLRATAFNLALSCLLCVPLFVVCAILENDLWKWLGSALTASVGIVLFYIIGKEFHFALKKIFPEEKGGNRNTDPPGGPAPEA